jgi:endogenous inhibitor of DNA gyrase (YacG/DUF329 family)
MTARNDREVGAIDLDAKLDELRRAQVVDGVAIALCVPGGAILSLNVSLWFAIPWTALLVVLVARRVMRVCPRCTQPLWAAMPPALFAPRCCSGCDLILDGRRRGETYVAPSRAVRAEPEPPVLDDDEDASEPATTSAPSLALAVDSSLESIAPGATAYRDAPLRVEPPDRYVAAWARLERSRRQGVLGAFAGVVTTVVGAGAVSATAGGAWPAAVALAGALSLVVFLEAKRFYCPRCGESFFRDGRKTSVGATACVHCGLRIGATERAQA